MTMAIEWSSLRCSTIIIITMFFFEDSCMFLDFKPHDELLEVVVTQRITLCIASKQLQYVRSLVDADIYHGSKLLSHAAHAVPPQYKTNELLQPLRRKPS